MADTALNRYIMQGTSTARATYTPSPATVAAGQPLGIFWFETDTSKIYAWNTSSTAWVLASGSGGGGGSVGYFSVPQFSMHTGSTPGTNLWIGRGLIVPQNMSITAISTWIIGSVPTAHLTPAIYAGNTGGTVGSLVTSGPTVTGAVAGQQDFPLTSSYVATAGTSLWIGLINTVAAVSFGVVPPGASSAYFTQSTDTPPSTPGTMSYDGGNTWHSFFLKGTLS